MYFLIFVCWLGLICWLLCLRRCTCLLFSLKFEFVGYSVFMLFCLSLDLCDWLGFDGAALWVLIVYLFLIFCGLFGVCGGGCCCGVIRLVRRACVGFRWVWVACEALFGGVWFVGGLVVVTLVCVGPRCYCWVWFG